MAPAESSADSTATDESGGAQNVPVSHTSNVRVRPLVGHKVWFRPRGWGGWGWSPASWEGWVVIGVYMVLVLGVSGTLRNESVVLGVSAIATAVLLMLATAKGTTPGGPKRLAEYRRLTADRSAALKVRRGVPDEPDLSEVLQHLKARRRCEQVEGDSTRWPP